MASQKNLTKQENPSRILLKPSRREQNARRIVSQLTQSDTDFGGNTIKTNKFYKS